jgi:hypothetical protein
LIKNAKVNFRFRLIHRILIDISQYLKTNTSVRQGTEVITNGWRNVSDKIIANCWKKSGTVFSSKIVGYSLEDMAVPEELWVVGSSKLRLDSALKFDEFNDVEDNLET